MTDQKPEPVVIEIVEKTNQPDNGGAAGVVVPNEIRINGKPVLALDAPVKIHAMEIPSRDAVLVTLTLFAKRITISQERPAADEDKAQPTEHA
jgi:hypothetical protein